MGNSSKKKEIGQSMIHKYAKSRVGYSTGFEVSPYQVACEALGIDGLPMPSGTTWKRWVLKNSDFIAGEVLKLKPSCAKPPARASSKRSLRNPRQSTESSVKSFIQNHSKINPASDDFLSTFEWKATRMMALKKYSPVCQCCGASAKTGAVMNVDHIKPRKIFPDLALNVDNLQILCGDCNAGKGNWDMTDWRQEATA